MAQTSSARCRYASWSTRLIRRLRRRCAKAANRLRYRDFLIVSLILNRKDVIPDNWIYIHEPGVRVGRIQNFKNWSPAMVPDPSKTCLGMEYFCLRKRRSVVEPG